MPEKRHDQVSVRVAQPGRRFFIIRRLILLVLISVALFCYGRPSVGSDGAAYYALTESLVKDHDFDLTNQLYLTGLAPQGFNDYRSIGGRISSPYSGGTAVLNAPFLYTALQLRAILAHYHIFPHVRDTFGDPDFLAQASILLASACFYVLTVLATVAIFQRRPEDPGDRGSRGLDPYLVAIAVSLSFPLFYYSFYETSFPHSADTFIVTLGFWVFAFRHRLQVRGRDLATPLLGFVLGFAIFIRSVNLALVPPYVGYLLLDQTRVARSSGASPVTRAAGALLKLAAGLVPAMLLVGAYNWHAYGSPVRFGYVITMADKILSPTLSNVGEIGTVLAHYLAHPVRGLFIWSPVALLAVLSAYQNRRRLLADDRLFVATLCPLCGLLGISLFKDWWAGISFGQRYAIMLFPFFAYLIWRLRWPVRRTVAAVLAGAAYSFVLMHFYLVAQHTPIGRQTLFHVSSFGGYYTPLDLAASTARVMAVQEGSPLIAIGSLIFQGSLLATIQRLTLQYQAPPDQEHYPVTQASPHMIGAVQREAGGRWALEGRREEVGHLLYGPYVGMPPGRYTAYFVLQVPERPPDTEVAILDVMAWPHWTSGSKQLALASLRGNDFRRVKGYQTFTLEFSLDQFSAVELRVYSIGRTILRVLETSVVSHMTVDQLWTPGY